MPLQIAKVLDRWFSFRLGAGDLSHRNGLFTTVGRPEDFVIQTGCRWWKSSSIGEIYIAIRSNPWMAICFIARWSNELSFS